MVPTVIERIDAMPRTASGKIDRVDLESRLRTSVAGGSAA
jgi:acyl-coenzyme A synthetase/AMP-(fatty) acid ligase